MPHLPLFILLVTAFQRKWGSFPSHKSLFPNTFQSYDLLSFPTSLSSTPVTCHQSCFSAVPLTTFLQIPLCHIRLYKMFSCCDFSAATESFPSKVKPCFPLESPAVLPGALFKLTSPAECSSPDGILCITSCLHMFCCSLWSREWSLTVTLWVLNE